jgi:broad specificity phosphatase PhoE
MGKIYFFRHGKTNENKTGIFCGVTDTGINLSEKIEFPKVDAVFCSP